MVPTFLQRRRPRTSSLRVPIALAGLVCLLTFYSVGLTWVITSQSLERVSKLYLIAGLLLTFLGSLGLLERLKR